MSNMTLTCLSRLGLFALACGAVRPRVALAQAQSAGRTRQVSHAAIYDPHPSPDGMRLVYIMRVAGREQLFVMDTGGRHAVQLTRDDADHDDPAWSPDGGTIAFVYMKNGAEVLALMDADGRSMREVTPRSMKAIHPTWHPDGTRLAFCTDDDVAPPKKNAADILVLDVATLAIRVLITGGVNTYPAWSPDGRQIAFRRMVGRDEKDSEVFVADADGTHAHNITNHVAFDGWPAWSPDGREIAFASNRADGVNFQIYLMHPDGSEVRRIADTTGRATARQWSRDGRLVYFPLCRRVDTGTDGAILSAAR